MTKARQRTVRHETPVIIDRRPLLVAETAQALLMRLKGTRQVIRLPWGAAYLRAAEMLAASMATGRGRARSVRRGAMARV